MDSWKTTRDYSFYFASVNCKLVPLGPDLDEAKRLSGQMVEKSSPISVYRAYLVGGWVQEPSEEPRIKTRWVEVKGDPNG